MHILKAPVVFLSIAVVALPLALTGCASSRSVEKMATGEEQVVERTPDRAPKWIEIPFEEKKDRMFFKGEASGAYDASLCQRQAKAAAVQNLVEAVKIKARSEFSEAVRGVNLSEQSLGRYLDSLVAWTSENVEITGTTPSDQYREKVQIRTYDGVKYAYNCFTRLSIPVENYLRARESALARLEDGGQDEEARALAMEAKEKLMH